MNAVLRNVLVLVASICGAGAALAGPCDAYFSFDGSLADSGGNGYDGRMVGAGGVAATPTFVEGKSGKALQLDGQSAMRALMDLHPDKCPQLTISAWIYVSPSSTEGLVVSSGGEQGPGLRYFTRSLQMLGPGNGVGVREVIYPDTWTFIALVYDPQNDIQRLHWGGRSSEQPMGERHMMPGSALWVGAYDQFVNNAPKGVVIDELRIVGEALDAKRVAALRDSASAATTTVADAGSADTALPQSCDASASCPSGYYCGIDRACHPDSQLPIESAGGETMISGLLGGTAGGTDVDIDRPDQPPDLSYATAGLAGRWMSLIVSGEGAPVADASDPGLYIEFTGPDSNLEGTITRNLDLGFSGTSIPEALVDVARNGDTVRFASQATGIFVGRVSGDGTMIIDTEAQTDNVLAFMRTETYPEGTRPASGSGSTGIGSGTPAGAGSGGAAATSGYPRPGADRIVTGVSGRTGERTFELEHYTESMGEFNNAWLTGIAISEKDNRPCYMEIEGLRPVVYPGDNFVHEHWDASHRTGLNCENTGSPAWNVSAKQGSPSPFEGGNATVIGRLQVCNNVNRNHRVKGVRVWADEIQRDGSTVYDQSSPYDAELPNCESWSTSVACPDGYMSTGLVAQVTGEESKPVNRQIVGLGLICRNISTAAE